MEDFAGSVPRIYETYIVPLLFAPYARDLARRVAARSPSRVLEIAAGTGAVTRELAARLPPETTLVATDRSRAMLDQAAALMPATARPIEWREADALQLPFEGDGFDAAVCQFGVMFFPDKPKAFSEARRVLRPGGEYHFSVWDKLSDNELADTVQSALEAVFPENPPRFMERTPHGYHDRTAIERDLRRGGFVASPEIETLTLRSRTPSARDAAIAFCQGTPLRDEIEARDASRLEEATDAAAAAIARRFGAGAADAKMQAHIVAVAR
ncbi:MAG TPA: class I SAM-dependent methyltransferase [Thermoanaerobaculia bacterium]